VLDVAVREFPPLETDAFEAKVLEPLVREPAVLLTAPVDGPPSVTDVTPVSPVTLELESELPVFMCG
jgi:hypothetical protein